MNLKIATIFTGFTGLILLLTTTTASSNPNTITVQQVGEQQVAMPDIENWTFNSMPNIVGMDAPSQLLKLGSLSSLGASEFTLEQTSAFLGVDVNQLTLNQLPLMGEQTLGNLVLGDGISSAGVPYLDQYKIKQIKPLATFFKNNPQFQDIQLSQNLGQFVANNPIAANIQLNELGNLKIGSIPNLGNTPLKDFVDWENFSLDSIPGISDIPLSQFPNPLNLSSISIIARIDTVRGPAEANWGRTVTGSSEVGFEFPCNKTSENTESCSHIELDDPENLGATVSSPFEGKAWINGQQQWVDGGSGLLKMAVLSPVAKPGLEPTGRFPFGGFAKMVLWEVDETNDSAQFVLFLRYCNTGGCTPYNIGPIPFMEYKRDAMIPIGSLRSNPPSNKLPIRTQQRLAQQQVRRQQPSISMRENIITGEEVAGGISPSILAEGIIKILSVGKSNSQSDFPPITCLGDRCGKSLGKYHLHSTHQKVIESITLHDGGEKFLLNLIKSNHPTPTALNKFFPPSKQDEVMRLIIGEAALLARSEIDPTTDKYFCGDRLIERTAQIFAGGLFTPIDSRVANADNSLTILKLGQKVRTYYNSHGGTVVSCATN